MTEKLNKLCLYALNYDLLLQLPIHRQHGSVKIQRVLTEETDKALIAEETLCVEALDLIEFLYRAEKSPETMDIKIQETRLKRLLPLLLYRYRPCSEQTAQIEDQQENTTPLVITKDHQLMQVLPFNFRPFNTGLRYDNWPLGRTQELILTVENHSEPGLEQTLLTSDQNVYYVAEPVDKLDWLRSKKSINGEKPFDEIKFYENIDSFFLKYAPRARMIRKARFRSTLAESREFRKFLFETKFYENNQSNQLAQLWDCCWRSFKNSSMVAHLLVLMQPTTIESFATYCCALQQLFQVATDGWTSEQKLQLENLCRSTPYEKSLDPLTAIHIAQVLQTIIEYLGTSLPCSQKLRAAATVLYAGLQSRFTAYQADTKSCVNSVLRIATTLEQSIDVEKTTFNTFFTNWQLWYLSQNIVSYLKDSMEGLQSIEFVGRYTQYAALELKIYSEEAFKNDVPAVSLAFEKIIK